VTAQSIRRPRLSPDGERVAFEAVEGANTAISVYEIDRGSRNRISTGP